MFSSCANNNNGSSLVIPKSSLGYHTNNKYSTFPPLMSDGRSIISTWQSQSQINNQLVKENNITTNWQYRQYLTNNALTIMEYNFRESANDTGFLFPVSKTTISSIHDNPLLLETSDLKQLYLTREQLNAKKNPF